MKQYEDILFEILSLDVEDVIRTSFGVDEDFVRRDLRRVMDIFDANGCVWDITLKDLETTGGDPDAIVRWVAIVRDELEKRYG